MLTMLTNTLVMAIREIRRNTMRSLLTMLGVVIGVGAVIALVTIGDGATLSITAGISKLGDNLLMVMPGAERRMGASGAPGQPLEAGDVHAIATEVQGASIVAPTASKNLLAVAGNRNWRTTVTGTTPAYLTARTFAVERGRAMSAAEVESGRPVCVLGQTPRRELFGGADPIGARIRLGKLHCEVIGLLEEKGSMMGTDSDDLILVPLKAFQQRIAGNRDISLVYVQVSKTRSTQSVKRQIEMLLRERRRIGLGEDDDFNVRDMAEIIDTVSSTTGILTALLGAVAAVSLLVGGIGIMNIMLVSVTERTREIGIRLAIGALGREVLMQFLIESVLISTLGGVIGVVLGLLSAFGLTSYLDYPFVVSAKMVGVAFVFSAAVGVLFGYLPARKAARFNPIDALRHE